MGKVMGSNVELLSPKYPNGLFRARRNEFVLKYPEKGIIFKEHTLFSGISATILCGTKPFFPLHSPQ